MENKPILQLEFHLRKPYNAAKLLIEAFNEIIEEGEEEKSASETIIQQRIEIF